MVFNGISVKTVRGLFGAYSHSRSDQKALKPFVLLVGRPGLDPGTLGLKGRPPRLCSSYRSRESSNCRGLRLMGTDESCGSEKYEGVNEGFLPSVYGHRGLTQNAKDLGIFSPNRE